MRTSEFITRPEHIRSSTIGAYELKSAMKINTIKGFLLTNITAVTLAVGLLFAGVFAAGTVISTAVKATGPIVIGTFSTDPEPIIDLPIEENNTKLGDLVTQFASGNPIPIPVAEITEVEFTDMDHMDQSLSNTKGTMISGENIDKYDIDNLNKSNTTNIETSSDAIPNEEDYIVYSREPEVDMSTISSSIIYPETAQKAGIEGRVTINVLINEKGQVIRTNIKSTSSAIFNNAAIDAVNKAVFTPALQGDKAVKSWITIPISFKLR